MSPTCPSCQSQSLVEGHLSAAGTEEGSPSRFHPKGLRLFTLRKAVALTAGTSFRACLACGHVWSSTNPSELRELLRAGGDDKTQQALERLDADDASKLRF